jgi:hypothetical protein
LTAKIKQTGEKIKSLLTCAIEVAYKNFGIRKLKFGLIQSSIARGEKRGYNLATENEEIILI